MSEHVSFNASLIPPGQNVEVSVTKKSKLMECMPVDMLALEHVTFLLSTCHKPNPFCTLAQFRWCSRCVYGCVYTYVFNIHVCDICYRYHIGQYHMGFDTICGMVIECFHAAAHVLSTWKGR